MTEPLFTADWDGRIYEQPSVLRLLVGGEAYCTLRAAWKWLKHERQAHVAVPLRRKVEVWRRGFFAESAVLYNLPRNDPRDYVNDFQYHRMIGRVNEWGGLYNRKLALRAFLLAMGLRQAPTVAYLLEGRIFAEPFTERARYITPGECLELLQVEGARYIVKPEDGRRGEGLFLLECRDGRLLRRRGRETQPLDLDAFLEQAAAGPPRATLIERWVAQGQFWDQLFPETANTLRVLTLWHPDDLTPFIARAVQRIGTAETVPTDNWSGGGISVPVDLATGRLGVGRLHPLKSAREDQRVTHHPDSGTPIEGAVIPGWSRVADTVLRAAGALPFNPMSGWDVLVDRDGEPVVVEGNANSDVNLLQVHGGLLADSATRRFYRAFGAV
ncbi:MAG: sugar-transfer associated ATP-grasp domain-containing protein [Gemmatimonadales bacterium]